MANDREPTQEWLTVGEAARILGVSDEAVRQKAKRRTLRSMKGNDGRLHVLIDTSATKGRPTNDQPKATQEITGEINVLQAYVDALKQQLEQQRVDHQTERGRLIGEIDRATAEADRRGADAERYRAELDREREHGRELAGKLDTAHRAHSDEAARLRQEIATFRTELARPWWRRLVRR
jgi:excisionase family DNA binding protein